MSIIHEALKKTGSSFQKKILPAVETKTGLGKIHLNPKTRSILIYGLAGVCAFFIVSALLIFIVAKIKTPKSPHRAEPIKSQIIDIKAVQEIKKLQEEPSITEEVTQPELLVVDPLEIKRKYKDSLDLNGIFFSPNDEYAIINNRVVWVGTQIQGAVVRKINVDSVELEASGVSFKLINPR